MENRKLIAFIFLDRVCDTAIFGNIRLLLPGTNLKGKKIGTGVYFTVRRRSEEDTLEMADCGLGLFVAPWNLCLIR